QAASCFDGTGGAYLYAREAFGPFIGFEIGWLTWVTRVAVAAALANGFALALGSLVPLLAEDGARFAVAFSALAFVTVINLAGVRAGARAGVVLAIGKLAPLLFFIVVGAWHIDGSRLDVFVLPHDGRLGEAALLLLFA